MGALSTLENETFRSFTSKVDKTLDFPLLSFSFVAADCNCLNGCSCKYNDLLGISQCQNALNRSFFGQFCERDEPKLLCKKNGLAIQIDDDKSKS